MLLPHFLSFLLLASLLPFAALAREAVVLEGNKVIGVEVMVADEGAQMQSSFGHALLRLVDNDGLWANDTVVSFAANVTGEINPFTGVFGGYDVQAEVRTLHEYWEKYPKLSNRGFKRYPINMSESELERFLSVLLDTAINTERLGDYKFVTNNCVSILTKIFNDAGITVDGDDKQYIPRSFGKWVDENSFSAFKPLIAQTFSRAKNYLQNNKQVDVEYLKNNFRLDEIAYVYLNHPYLDFNAMDELGAHLQKSGVDMNRGYGLDPLPEILYTKSFGEEFLAAEKSVFGLKGAKENALRRFGLQHDTRKGNALMAEANIPGVLKAEMLMEKYLFGIERLRSFRAFKSGDTVIVKLALTDSSSSAGFGDTYRIEGLQGELERIDRSTFAIGETFIKAVESNRSVEIYLLK